MRLQGKVALITGGNAGIGRATAELFAKEGGRVVVAARNAERGGETVRAIADLGGEARFVRCDVRQAEDCQRAVQSAVQGYGRLDVLVNNAGIIFRDSDVVETSIEQWDNLFAVNVRGTFLMCKYAMPVMLEAGGGRIVNVSSYFGLVAGEGLVAYCSSKAAVVNMTRAMALDHAKDGIRVNCVCPGSVHTPMIEAAWEAYGANAEEVWAAKHPIGRIATPEEVAQAILYLASDESSFITGVALPVDGGLTAA